MNAHIDIQTAPEVFPALENTRAGLMRKVSVLCEIQTACAAIWSWGIPRCIKRRTVEGAISYYQNTRCVPEESTLAVHEFIADMLPVSITDDLSGFSIEEYREIFSAIRKEAQRQEEHLRRMIEWVSK